MTRWVYEPFDDEDGDVIPLYRGFIQTDFYDATNFYGVVYKITNTINGKMYIGQTTNNPPYRRFISHCGDTSSRISKAIRKYGKNAFSFEIIAHALDRDDLNSKETHEIANSNSIKLGYNVCPTFTPTGGKGEENLFFGRKHTEKTKQKLRKANTGRPSPLRGIPLSPMRVEQLRQLNLGKTLSPEHKTKIKIANIGKGKPGTAAALSKPVYYSVEDKVYASVKVFCEAHPVFFSSTVSTILTGKSKLTTGKYMSLVGTLTYIEKSTKC